MPCSDPEDGLHPGLPTGSSLDLLQKRQRRGGRVPRGRNCRYCSCQIKWPGGAVKKGCARAARAQQLLLAHRVGDLDTPVLGAALIGRVGRDGPRLAIASRGQPDRRTLCWASQYDGCAEPRKRLIVVSLPTLSVWPWISSFNVGAWIMSATTWRSTASDSGFNVDLLKSNSTPVSARWHLLPRSVANWSARSSHRRP